MRFLIASLFAAALLAAAGSSQCPTVSTRQFGSSCAFFGQTADLALRYDSTTCRLSIEVPMPQTCCNTIPRTHLLVIGATPFTQGLPHPLLLPGCLLYTDPLVVLARAWVPNVRIRWILGLGGVRRATFFVQGFNHFFTTIGFTHDFQASDGARVDVQ